MLFAIAKPQQRLLVLKQQRCKRPAHQERILPCHYSQLAVALCIFPCRPPHAGRSNKVALSAPYTLVEKPVKAVTGMQLHKNGSQQHLYFAELFHGEHTVYPRTIQSYVIQGLIDTGVVDIGFGTDDWLFVRDG